MTKQLKATNANSQNAPQEENWVFIDLQNLYKGVQERGWKINWPSFRSHLTHKYSAVKAVIFTGFVSGNEWLYRKLTMAGFQVETRPTRILPDGTIDGGNCDADLASYVMDYKADYSKAIIVADDADYYRTIQSLQRQNKLRLIISSHLLANTSSLIKQAVSRDMLVSIHGLRNQISQTIN